jgi:hypothetical protein
MNQGRFAPFVIQDDSRNPDFPFIERRKKTLNCPSLL